MFWYKNVSRLKFCTCGAQRLSLTGLPHIETFCVNGSYILEAKKAQELFYKWNLEVISPILILTASRCNQYHRLVFK
jgi:hypothetical protein